VAAGYAIAFQIGKGPPAIPLLHDDLGVDGVTAGLVLSISALTAALGGVWFGQIADRIGRRRTALAGLVITFAAAAAGAAATGVPMLLATRVLEGVGFTATAVAVPSLIAAIVHRPADQRLALGLWGSYISMASAIVMLIAPLVFALGGWRLMWLLAAACTALAAAAVALWIPDVRTSSRPASSWAGVRTVVQAGYPLVAGAAFGAYVASYYVVIGFLPTILVAAGRSVANASLLSTIVVFASGVGTILGGFALRHFSRLQVMLTGAIVLGAGGAIEYLPIPIPWRLAAATTAMLFGGLVPGAIGAGIPLLSPTPALIATTQGMVMQLTTTGQLIGPTLVAALGGERGGSAGSLVLLGLSVIGVGAAVVLARAPHGAKY
jgi:MFS family permease